VRGLARLGAARARGAPPPSWPAILEVAAVPAGAGGWTRAERLRLCLALARALEPAHVLLEVEPPLESVEDRRALGGLVRRLVSEGRGVLIGTRDELLLADVAAHVLIFEDGEVLAEGAPEAVLAAAVRRAREGRLP
jgi:ABC-type histidine transport system ATPase subunit